MTGPRSDDRRATIALTDAEIDTIAEKAAEKAIAKITTQMYVEVGKGVVSKLMYIIGLSAVGLYLFLKQKGIV